MSRDGTPPLRVVFRCKARKGERLWYRDRQSLFMPKDIFITHICFYAVRSEYCHGHHLSETVLNCTDEANVAAEAGRLMQQQNHFRYTSLVSALCVLHLRKKRTRH